MLILLRDQRFLGMQYHRVPNVNKANTLLAVGIMIDQVLSGQLTKQLIQDLDGCIALNKALNYDIMLLKLNSSEHIKYV